MQHWRPVLFCALVTACAGDPVDVIPGPDAATNLDAPTTGGDGPLAVDATPGTPDATSGADAAPPPFCYAPASFGDLGNETGVAYFDGDPLNDHVTARANLADYNGYTHKLEVVLIPDYGVFPTGLTTGTFEINTGGSTCGACTYFTLANMGTPVETNEARSGTITVTKVPQFTGDSVSFTLTNLVIGPREGFGGDARCESYVANLSYTANTF